MQSRSFSTFQDPNWVSEYNNQRINNEYRDFVPEYAGYSEKVTNYNQSQISESDNYNNLPNYVVRASDYGVNVSDYNNIQSELVSEANPRSIDSEDQRICVPESLSDVCLPWHLQY